MTTSSDRRASGGHELEGLPDRRNTMTTTSDPALLERETLPRQANLLGPVWCIN